MRNLPKNKKGFMLIMLYIILVVLIIWDAAFFLASIHESKVTKISLDSLGSLYSAEKGLSCAIYEIKTHLGWYTHFADPDNNYVLTKTNPSPQANLTTLCKIENQGDYDGCYVSRTNVPGTTIPEFALKTYLDPTSTPESPKTVVLIKGNSPSISRLFITKVNAFSLYDFFVFTPYDLWMGNKLWKAIGGKMHANGSVVWLGSSIIEDVSEFTTPQSFRYNITADVPPDPGQEEYVNDTVTPPPCLAWPGNPACGGNPDFPLTWTDIYSTGLRSISINPCYPSATNCVNKSYLNYQDAHLAGDMFRLKMFNGNSYVPWDGVGPYTSPLGNPGIYQIPGSYTKFIKNGTPISVPNRLAQTYDWQKYSGATQAYHYPEQPISQVAYTNSGKQQGIGGWPEFLNNNGLNGILKDGSAGGQYLEPQTVMTDIFHDEAEAGGLLIFKNADDKLAMRINGAPALVEEDGVIKDPDGKVLAEKITFYNTNSGWQNTVARLNVKNLREGGFYPINGMLYCQDFSLALFDAQKIDNIGLTAVSSENIILEGDFNNISAAPAAMITAKETYTVSDNFKYPGSLPFTLHNPNFPFESDADWDWSKYADEMPNFVDRDYTYVTSLMGSTRGYLGEVLERWGENTRTIIGSSIQLIYADFPPPSWLDAQRTRYCCLPDQQPPDCFLGPYCRDITLPRWSGEGMTFTYPTPNTYQFDINYLPGSVSPRPPGDFFGYSKEVWLEINYNDTNFTRHYAPIN